MGEVTVSLPYFPMYPTDFEAKTSHLTLAEDGAYNRLLRICWMTPGCTMPADEAWIMRRARAVTDEEKDAVRAVLAEFFKVQNGRYSNARLAREWLAANEAHERRKNAGAKGGAAKARKTNAKRPSNAVAKPKQPEPEPEPKRDTNVSLPRERGSAFEEWWRIVPRKIGKEAARKAYARALRLTDEATLFSAMTRHAKERSGKDPQYTPHPATWLNQGRWQDSPDPSPQSFHDDFERMLRDEIRGADSIDRGEVERLPAGFQSPGPSGRSWADGPHPEDGGRGQQAHLSLVRPRRFGGSHG